MSVFDDFISKVEELVKNEIDKVGMHQVFEARLALLKNCEEQYINKLQKNFQKKNLQKIDEDDELLSSKPRKGSIDSNSSKSKRKVSKIIDEPVQFEKPTEAETRAPSKNSETEKASAKKSAETETDKTKNLLAQKSSEKSPRSQTDELEDKDKDGSEKRTKRNASAKATANINKQVNQSLNQKMRRPGTETDTIQKESVDGNKAIEKETIDGNKANQKETVDGSKTSRCRKGKEEMENKENETNNLPVIQIKQEKMSIVPEHDTTSAVLTPMEAVIVKLEMPPPSMPAPQRTKRQPAKEKATLQQTEEKEQPSEETVPEPPARSSKVRGKKKDEIAPIAVPAARRTRASSRVCQDDDFVVPPPPKDVRPKRTRAKKVQSDALDECSNLESTTSTRTTKMNKDTVEDQSINSDSDSSSKVGQETTTVEPRTKRTKTVKKSEAVTEAIDADAKARPKRTRKANAAEKPSEISKEPEPPAADIQTEKPANDDKCNSKVTLEQKSSTNSPILTSKVKRFKKNPSEEDSDESLERDRNSRGKRSLERSDSDNRSNTENTKEIDRGTRVLRSSLERRNSLKNQEQTTVTVNCQDQTVIIAQTVSEPVTPVKKKICLDETVVIDKVYRGNIANETVIIDTGSVPQRNAAMNETVTLNGVHNVTAINGNESLLTDDNSEIEETPPHIVMASKKKDAPGSAVKERVQQFEELGARVTRTKTRAMSKQADDSEPAKEQVGAKAALFSSSLLTKMKQMAHPTSVKLTQSSSAVKPSRNNIVGAGVKSFIPASMSKAATLAKAKEQADEIRREKEKEREDPQRKKEAMLEAKREEQKRRREEKIAAAAAAREQAAAQRRAAVEAAAKEREYRALQISQEKAERMKEMEKKRLALERKVQETEERRRAEDAAKMAKLEDEQRRAAELRRKNNEEAEKMKKEALAMEKEIAAARLHYQAKEKEEKRKKMLMKQRIEAQKASALMAANIPAVHMADGFEFLCSDDSDDENAKPRPKCTPPLWSRSKERWYQLSVQSNISTSHIDKLFSVGVHSPNLSEVFPTIDQRLLKRTSSAVWRTPPSKSLHTLKE